MSIIVETSNINSLQNGYNRIRETTSNKNKRNLPPLIDMLLDSLIAVDFVYLALIANTTMSNNYVGHELQC